MEIERTCYFCHKKFMAHHNNHGTLYKNKKIYVCQKCLTITKKCFICGKDVSVRFTSIDKNVFCSRKCVIKNMKKICKENETGIYNPKVRAKAIKAAHTPEVCKLRSELMKLNGTGLYDLIGRAKGQIAAHSSETNEKRNDKLKLNGLGLYDPKVRAKGREAAYNAVIENIKAFISSNITTNLFIDNSFSEINAADYDSFIQYNKVSGIWAIYGQNSNNEKICLDVCQTKDIGKEMRLSVRKIVSQKIFKYKEFVNYKNIIFTIVKLNINNFNDRELIEAIYAYKFNAKYWLPSPTQLKYINENDKDFYIKSIIV